MKRPLDPLSVQRAETPSASYVLRRRYGPVRHVIMAVNWLTVFSMLFQPVVALAVTRNWEGDTDTAWGTAGNWDTAPVSDLTTDIANFNLAGPYQAASTPRHPNAGTVSINGIAIGASNGAMTLSGTALSIGAGGITIASGAGALTISSPITLGASQSWANNSANTLTVSAPITGTGNITKTGTGTVKIQNSTIPSFSTITLSGGTLALAAEAPAIITDSSTLWFDASKASTIAKDGSNKVITWASRSTGTYAGAYAEARKVSGPDNGLTYSTGTDALYNATGGPSSLPAIQLTRNNFFNLKTAAGANISLTDIKSVFWVYNSGAWMLGENESVNNTGGAVNSFHRGAGGYGANASDPILAGSNGMDWRKGTTTMGSVTPTSTAVGSTWSIFDAIHPTGSAQAGSIGLGNYSISRTGNFNVSEVIIFNTKLDATQRDTVEAYLKSKWVDGGGNPDPTINRPNTHVDTTASSTLNLGSATSDHTLGKFSVAGGATLTIANAKSVTLNGIGTSPTVSIAATGSSGTTATINGTATLYPKTDITASGASLSITAPVVINGSDPRNVSGNVTMASLDLSSAAGTISTGTDKLGVSGTLSLPNNVTARYTAGGGATSFNAQGSDLANNTAGRTLTLSGGTLQLANQSGSAVINTFTYTGSAANFAVPNALTAKVLAVAGGGGGGKGEGAAMGDGAGGGGAGGLIYNAAKEFSAGNYTIYVGDGGAGSTGNSARGVNGQDSYIQLSGSDVFRAIGGGGGGSDNYNAINQGADGGSGGGAASSHNQTWLGGSATSGQGNVGGSTSYRGGSWGPRGGAGGGGAGLAGTSEETTDYEWKGKKGGDGLSYSISGSSDYYAGGGGGGNCRDDNGTPGGAGGAGGGGAGGAASTNGGNGTPNTGGGGGGGGGGGTGGKGGSGIVIVSYNDFSVINLANTHIAATADSTLDLAASGVGHTLGNITVSASASANTMLTVNNVTSLTIGTLTIGINGAYYGKLNLGTKELKFNGATKLAVTSTSPAVPECCVAVAKNGSFDGLHGQQVTETGGRKWKVEVRESGAQLWLVAAPGGTVIMFK